MRDQIRGPGNKVVPTYFDKVGESIYWKKIAYSTNSASKTGYLPKEKRNWIYFSHFVQKSIQNRSKTSM